MCLCGLCVQQIICVGLSLSPPSPSRLPNPHKGPPPMDGDHAVTVDMARVRAVNTVARNGSKGSLVT